MKREEQTHPQDDKFEPIELGSVSDQTKGDVALPEEGILRPFSRAE